MSERRSVAAPRQMLMANNAMRGRPRIVNPILFSAMGSINGNCALNK